MNRIVLPTVSGAYRWYYVDVTSGPTTAVFIFMLGSVFSGRYARRARLGALPIEHAAVNFALYENGVRTRWALSEYSNATVTDDGRRLTIGNSTLTYDLSGVTIELDDRTTPFMVTGMGTPVRASARLSLSGPTHDEVVLVPGLSHRWRPIAARADASFNIDDGPALDGFGYHDGNHGEVLLGTDLRGWEWTRTHRADATEIHYRPWADAPGTLVKVTSTASVREAIEPRALPAKKSGWGLALPEDTGALLESSPFYARHEMKSDGSHVLGEVADFARFQKPSVRWMAGFKTRRVTR